MNELHNLNQKIEYEFTQIKKELDVIIKIEKISKERNLDDIELRAAASTLHSIYNGSEKILIIKFKALKISLPDNPKWHSQLLSQAKDHKIITKITYLELKKLMSFRHFYRHAYGFMLDKDLIDPLLKNSNEIINKFQNEIMGSA